MDLQGIDLHHPYLNSQLIAYIGNKRRLLPLLYRAVERCVGVPVQRTGRGPLFIDLFAGSGVVSRLAKYLGFSVISNDWEVFSYIINKTHIETNADEISSLFADAGGMDALLEHLNHLPAPEPEDQYIARHYAPTGFDIDTVDFRRERLFYTRENALRIDAIRNEIERLYPGSDPRMMDKEKALLLSLLLYEAATHTNTSGVFKAYHKGFGGHGRDALSRILAPITLRRPVLIDTSRECRACKQDANTLVTDPELTRDPPTIVYVDPPYNQHQYGSNYHMLNTIALWDRPPINDQLTEEGVLEEKAAIRKDWVQTKSRYCYRDSAAGAFGDLIARIRADFILISYSTEGIIPFPLMREICEEKGAVTIVTNQYIKYRGGKQSISRLNKNIEFVLIIDTHKNGNGSGGADLEHLLEKQKVAGLFDMRYRLACLEEYCTVDREAKLVWVRLGEREVMIPTRELLELVFTDEIAALSREELHRLAGILEQCQCKDRTEELSEILERIAEEGVDRYYLMRQLPGIVRKIAHKKYSRQFEYWLARIKELQQVYPDEYALISRKVGEVEELAQKRFSH